MKVKETVGEIGTFAFVAAATAGLAVAGVIQLAAAGVELLVVAPFASGRRKSRAPQMTVLPRSGERGEPIGVRLPRAA